MEAREWTQKTQETEFKGLGVEKKQQQGGVRRERRWGKRTGDAIHWEREHRKRCNFQCVHFEVGGVGNNEFDCEH